MSDDTPGRRPEPTAFDRVIGALEGHGSQVRRVGRTTMAQCPAHADRTPSLGVTETDDRVLVKCYAGCAIEDVLAALGLTLAELFDQPAGSRRGQDVRRPAPSLLPAWARIRHYGSTE